MKSKDSNNMITIAIELKGIYKIKETLKIWHSQSMYCKGG